MAVSFVNMQIPDGSIQTNIVDGIGQLQRFDSEGRTIEAYVYGPGLVEADLPKHFFVKEGTRNQYSLEKLSTGCWRYTRERFDG